MIATSAIKHLIRSNLFRFAGAPVEGSFVRGLSGFTSPNKNSPGDESPAEDPASDINKLKEENAKLLETVKDIDDKYKRALAEAENTRIRARKQVEESKVYAIQAFCKDLLEVADIFKAAIDSVQKESLEKNPELKNLYDGVVMTEQKLLNVFLRHGLVPINPIGAKFDPNEHHALFQVDEPGKEPGTVAAVNKIGFKLHERVIRPAMVGVVKE